MGSGSKAKIRAQLVIEGLPSEFPPIRTLDATPNNLPIQATAFFGREAQIADVVEELRASHEVEAVGIGSSITSSTFCISTVLTSEPRRSSSASAFSVSS